MKSAGRFYKKKKDDYCLNVRNQYELKITIVKRCSEGEINLHQDWNTMEKWSPLLSSILPPLLKLISVSLQTSEASYVKGCSKRPIFPNTLLVSTQDIA